MKLLFMGSLPTFKFAEDRDISEQEQPFIKACNDMGYAAAQRGYTVLIADDHISSADYHVAQGIVRFSEENPDKISNVEVHRPEGLDLAYKDCPKNIVITRKFYAETDRSQLGTGTLIPNLAALDASDVMVVIGGKLTVKLMGNIAADRDKGVLAIPAFGGSSAELYDRLKYYYKNSMKDQSDELAVLQSIWLPGSGEKVLDLAEALATSDEGIKPHSYFISYTWKESEFADHVEVLLQRKKRPVNRDESMFLAGADLSDIVKSLIQESDTFIGLWSDKFKNSTWCPHELEYALNRQSEGLQPNRVLLLTLDGTEPPIRFTGKLRLAGETREKRDLNIRRLIEEE